VALAKLLSLLLLFIDLQVEILFFNNFSGEFLTSFRDITLCHLIELLKLVEKFILVADQLLLFIDLPTKLSHVCILILPLELDLRFQRSLIVFLLLNRRLLGLHLYSEGLSLLVELLLLLTQNIEGIQQTLHGCLSTLSKLRNDRLSSSNPLSEDARLISNPLDILDHVVEVTAV